MAKKIKATKTSSSSEANPQQQTMLLAGVIGLGVILIIGVVVLNQLSAGSAVTIEESETYAGIPIAGEYANVREVERASDVAETVTRGIAEDGLPYIGNLDAPIYLAEISDFTCPACMNYHSEVKNVIEGLARSGDLAFFYVPTPAAGRDPYATNAARGAVCAAEQGGFWEMHDEIFRVHAAESPQSFTPERMESMAEAIGLNGNEIRACMNTNTADSALLSAQRIAQQNGANSTPTILYSLDGGETWNYIGERSGGGRSYADIETIVRAANEAATGG